MKRTIITALALSILLGSLGAGTGQADTRPLQYRATGVVEQVKRSGPCRDIRWAHAENKYRAVKRLIVCANERWPAPGGVMKIFDVVDCESGFFWRSHTPGTSFYGVFQIGHSSTHPEWDTWDRPQLWDNWWDGVEPGPFNARANVILGVFHAARLGWGSWTCG